MSGSRKVTARTRYRISPSVKMVSSCVSPDSGTVSGSKVSDLCYFHVAMAHRLCAMQRLHAVRRALPRSDLAYYGFPTLCLLSRPTDGWTDATEPLFTYSIITTDSNKQLGFLHDRMPVILENGSEAIRTWLDPNRTEWNKDLQSLLQPYQGELECYPVSKEVGKVGNNSPSFLVPINSAANKNNIANFFGNQKKDIKSVTQKQTKVKVEHELDKAANESQQVKVQDDIDETSATRTKAESREDNVTLPIPASFNSVSDDRATRMKRERSSEELVGDTGAAKPEHKRSKPAAPASATRVSAKKPPKKQGRRSATSNGSASKSGKSEGSKKITAFFDHK